MFVLSGVFRGEVLESLFTANERDTAVEIAREWYRKGWRPFLKEYNGQGAMVVQFLPAMKLAA